MWKYHDTKDSLLNKQEDRSDAIYYVRILHLTQIGGTISAVTEKRRSVIEPRYFLNVLDRTDQLKVEIYFRQRYDKRE